MKFGGSNLIAKDWIVLILGTCERLKPHLKSFYMMKPISQLMMSYFEQQRLCWHTASHQDTSLNPPASFTLLDFQSIKETQGVKETTRIVPLFYISNPEANGFAGAVILTETGTLHWWKWFGKNLGTYRNNETVTRAIIEPFTVNTMRAEFGTGARMPYIIFRNLSHLPQLHAQHCREYLSNLEELSGFCIGSCNLIEEIR